MGLLKMKKFTLILLSLLCLCIAGCAPSAKEEAERLHNDYMLSTRATWNDEFIPKLQKITNTKKNGDEQDKEIAALAEQYKPKMLEFDKKLQGEKVQKSNEHLLELDKQQIKNSIHFLDTLILIKDKSNLNEQEWKKDFRLATLALLNTRLEYNNEYSKITTGKGTYELTLANYQKIHQGDTYEQVANLFKMPGKLETSSNLQAVNEQYWSESYIWEIGDARVYIIFHQGKASSASQFYLK